MPCSLCGGGMATERVDIAETWKCRTITFCDIEAEVCSSCGMKVYDAVDVAMMEAIIEGTLDKGEYPEKVHADEVSRVLRLTPRVVCDLLRTGRISPIKTGREWTYTRESLLQLLDLPAKELTRRECFPS